MLGKGLPSFAVLFGVIGLLVAVVGCPQNPNQVKNSLAKKRKKDEKFEKIKIGMTRAEAEKILGDGREVGKEEAKQRLDAIPNKLDFTSLLEKAVWIKYDNDQTSYLVGYRDGQVAITNREGP